MFPALARPPDWLSLIAMPVSLEVSGRVFLSSFVLAGLSADVFAASASLSVFFEADFAASFLSDAGAVTSVAREADLAA